MQNAEIFTESKLARDGQLANVNHEQAQKVLDKAKAMCFAAWQGTGIATNEQIAEFYEIPIETVKTVYNRYKDEFLTDGAREVRGKELKSLPCIGRGGLKLPSSVTRLVVWTPRAALRLGMLLRDSEIAKAVRNLILDLAVNVVPAQNDRLRELELQLQLAQTQERLLATSGAIASLHGTGMLALIMGRPDAVVEVEIPTTVMVDAYGQPIQKFDSVGITYLAKRYGFGDTQKGRDSCRAWLKSIGVKDEQWVNEPSIRTNTKLPRELLGFIDRQHASKKGVRQMCIGEER